tara:strand:- start:161 stop:514 length:354 start_codon:yes stop_codon:yes gene_type:complete
MKNHKLKTKQLESMKVLEMKEALCIDIQEITDDRVLVLVNGGFNCSVKYLREEYQEQVEVSVQNGTIITELGTFIEVNVFCDTFKTIKGHFINCHPDIICLAIEEALIYQLLNSEQC